MPINVTITNASGIKYLPLKKISSTVERVCSGEKIKAAEISVIILNSNDIKTINKKYLNHNYITDVIAFSLSDDTIDAEIYICAEQAQKQAREYKVSTTNELMRLAAHGTLHVVGYDDVEDEDRAEMHLLENKYIS